MYCSQKLARLRSRYPLEKARPNNFCSRQLSVSKHLAKFIPQWLEKPSGSKLPRKKCFQLTKLHSQSGRFANGMHRWGLSKRVACDCGSEVQIYIQARSQKFAVGGAVVGAWGRIPQPPEARGSGGRALSARKFCIFFAKITSF